MQILQFGGFLKMKNLLFGFLAFVGLSFFFIPQGASAHSEKVDLNDLISQVKVFDENNNEIPYTTEELEQLIRFDSNSTLSENSISPLATKKYNYGPVTFTYNFYIGPGSNGIAFYNPEDTLFTVNGTAQKIKVIAYNDTGTGSGTVARTVELPGGWTGTVHMSTWSTLPRGKKYRFKVQNVNEKKFTINNVQVVYN